MLIFFRIYRIRNYLTKAATEILVLSLVVSHLDNCNLILYGIAEIELTKMQLLYMFKHLLRPIMIYFTVHIYYFSHLKSVLCCKFLIF